MICSVKLYPAALNYCGLRATELLVVANPVLEYQHGKGRSTLEAFEPYAPKRL